MGSAELPCEVRARPRGRGGAMCRYPERARGTVSYLLAAEEWKRTLLPLSAVPAARGGRAGGPRGARPPEGVQLAPRQALFDAPRTTGCRCTAPKSKS